MAKYRRAYIPGGTFFLTLVTYHRTPYFPNPKTLPVCVLHLLKLARRDPLKLLVLLFYRIIFISYGLYRLKIPLIHTVCLGLRCCLRARYGVKNPYRRMYRHHVVNIEKVMYGSGDFGSI
jgi:hypothetical protein